MLTIAIENSYKALFELDELENKRPRTTPEVNFRRILKNHIICKNSKFFQELASERLRINKIASLTTDNGACVEDHAGKESILFDAFRQRFGTCTKPNMKFNLSTLLRHQVDFDSLTTPFTHDEIDDVIKDMP